MSNTSSSKPKDRLESSLMSDQQLEFKSGRAGLKETTLKKDFLKSSTISLFLLIAFAIASIWLANGTSWIYDSSLDSSPLQSCVSLWNYDPFSQAQFCTVQITPWSPDIYRQIQSSGWYASTAEVAKEEGVCVLPLLDNELTTPELFAEYALTQEPITCYSRKACDYTTNWYPLNPYSVSSVDIHHVQSMCALQIQTLVIDLNCFQIYDVEAMCDGAFNVDPAGIVAIRGLLLGVLVLWLSLVGNDLFVFFQISGYNRRAMDYRKSVVGPSIVAERRELFERCVAKWSLVVSNGMKREGTCASSVASSGCGSTTPVNASGASTPRRMPSQPLLTPRTAIVMDAKASPRGYSPRQDSPPVAVVSSIAGAAKLGRVNGTTVETTFRTVWKKKVAKYFKLRAKNLASVSLQTSNLLFSFLLYAILVVGFFTLVFRLVLAVVTLPWVAQLPGGISLTELAGMNDLTGSLASIIVDDAAGNNELGRPVLFMWVDFFAFLDLLTETALLIIPALFAIMKPTNLEAVDKAAIKPIDDTATGSIERYVSRDRLTADESMGSSPVSGLSFDLSPKIRNALAAGGGCGPAGGGSSSPCFSVGSGSPNIHHSSSFREPDAGVLPSSAVVCVLVSVCSPCATAESKKAFVRNLKSIIGLVESEADIFVVDCGPNREPIDDTEFVILKEVSERIHYAYFPENSRVLSLYWTSKYWVPFLFASGLCGDYVYTLIVDESIWFPSSFTLPSTDYLFSNPKIKAMYVPMNEQVAGLSPGWVSKWQEQIELVSLFRVTKSSMHAGDGCVPQIWERNAFEMTCFNRKVPIGKIESLNCKVNGRLLLKERGNSRMTPWISAGEKPTRANNAYGVYPGSELMMSFRSNLHELVNPTSFVHIPSIVAKYAILIEILNVFFDAMRLFLVCAMLLRDPIGLGIVAVVCALITTVPYLLSLLANLRYQEKKRQRVFFLILLYPITLLVAVLPARALTLFQQKAFSLVFRKFENDVTIGEREEEFRDLPIVPPHPAPHWGTVWQ